MIRGQREYKESGVEWIDKIPIDWIVLRIKSLGTVSTSSVDKKIVEGEELVNLVNYLDVYNSKNKKIDTSIQFMKVSASENQKTSSDLEVGDVLFTPSSETIEDIGHSAVVTEELQNTLYSYHILRLRFNKRSLLLNEFKRYAFNNIFFLNQLSSKARGTTRMTLGLKDFYSSLVIVPPLPEQTQIAAFLDHQTALIDALIAKKEALIEKLKLQRQAIINEAVTKGLDPNTKMKDSGIEWLGEIPEEWEAKRLKYIFRIQKRIAGELGYDVLSVTQRGLKVKDLEDFSGQHSMDYSKYQIVMPGDFVMNHMDLLTGFVDISSQVGVTSPDYRVFELIDNRCNPKYFLYLNQMCYAEKIFYAHGQGVSTLGRWRLQSKEFNNMRFPFPSFEQQNEIVSFLDQEFLKMDRLSLKLQNFIEKLKLYRQSLISEAVTGKIDVREWEPRKTK